jgi:hypothetical protein
MLVMQAGPPGLWRELAGTASKLSVDEHHAVVVPTEGIGSGVHRVMEHAGHQGLAGGDPVEAASGDIAGRHLEPVLGEVASHPIGAAVQTEALEDEADGALNLLVGIESKALGVRVPLVAGGRNEVERAAPGLAELAALKA